MFHDAVSPTLAEEGSKLPPACEETDDGDSRSTGSSDDSTDEALMEMLGLTSLEDVIEEEADDTQDIAFRKDSVPVLPSLSDKEIKDLVETHRLKQGYESESVCVFPSECSIPAEYMRRLTEELMWGGESRQADKTYETVQVYRDGEVHPKKSLTRLEHFVDYHDGWAELCHDYLRRLVSEVLGIEMVLYKEKLNLKPPGGSGFAPHLDTPSLRIALGESGPQEFCTVMVAIDDMTVNNGCLRICKGSWSEKHCVSTIAPETDGNPDAGGRAGAVPLEVANALDFDSLDCRGGTIAVFNGWAPHRSSANMTWFPRRAVFLTYNPKEEGDFHKRYYQMMNEKRQRWRDSVGLVDRERREEDEKMEIQALTTIPKI